MPKNTVSDPITDQEMAFAHLVLSGTMNDRRAAEAVGINPDTAAYTKSKPRVRAYMIEHRAVVREKLVDQEAEGLRRLNLGRDQILARLWQLANLSPEATRGIIAGQIKALAMIVAMERLIPDRPGNTPVDAQPYRAAWLREQEQAEATLPDDAVPAAQVPPNLAHTPEPETVLERDPQPANHPPSPNLDRNHPGPGNPSIHSKSPNWVPAATTSTLDVLLQASSSRRPPFSPPKGWNARRR